MGGFVVRRVSPYPDENAWTKPSDPRELRRFFDLRIELLVSRPTLGQFDVPPSFRVPPVD